MITPTRRLARHVTRAYNQRQTASGRRAWLSPDVLPWDAWVERCLEELALTAIGASQRLNPVQEQELWCHVISDALPGVDVVPLARLAQEAWMLQHEWRIAPARADGPHSAEARAYALWAEEFASRCRRRGWVSRAEAAEILTYTAPASWLGRRIEFHAFDALSPQHAAITMCCERAGSQVRLTEVPQARGQPSRLDCEDSTDEYRRVAAATRRILERNAAARIGIVVPDLAAERDAVLRALDESLDPAGAASSRGTMGEAYNVSLGLPLARWPAVRTLLTTLRLACQETALASVGEWLLSAYLGGGQSELHERALFDACLRERGALVVTAGDLLEALTDFHRASGRCRNLTVRASSWFARARTWQGRRLPSQWLEEFAGSLDAMGWPGERTLDSADYQVIDKTREVMWQLATLDIVSGTVTAGEALGHLSRVLANALFQPESEDCPVQVLGVLESAGLEFDHLFVTGVTDQAWPMLQRPNPLLPPSLQRARDVPHSSLEWERGFALRMMDLWAATTGQVVYSWPRWRQNTQMRPSALLHSMAHAADAAEPCPASRAARIWAARAVERIDDERAPPLPPGATVRGGARVLADQSLCPFKAFATHRLVASVLEEGRVGPDARARGNLVHAVMAAFTRRVDSLASLLALDEAALRAQVRAAVDEGFAQQAERPGYLLPQALHETERERLARMLDLFAGLERQRAPYRVLTSESTADITLNGLTVRARPDRVDEIDVAGIGKRLGVIDYKTGQVTASAWLGDRPADPQLPLYALAQAGEVGLVAFVALRGDAVAWKGLSEHPGLVPGVKQLSSDETGAAGSDWALLMAQWRVNLERLAGEYLQGYAAVDPLDGDATCSRCGLQSLCRVDEQCVGRSDRDRDDESN